MVFNKADFERYSEVLSNRIDELKPFLESDDDRSVRCRRRNGMFFFSVRESGDCGRKELYIPKDELRGYKTLARKAYAKKLLPSLENDLKAIDKFLSGFSWQEELLTADEIDPELVRLCGNGFESRSTFIDKWISQTWTDRPAAGGDPDRPTLSGINVRSKSEEFIANALYNHGLLFFYEKPLYLPGLKYPKFPDFTILDLRSLDEVYWEHFGRMDDPVYADANCKKLMDCMRSGLYPGPGFITTFETTDHPLSSLDVEMIIEKFFL